MIRIDPESAVSHPEDAISLGEFFQTIRNINVIALGAVLGTQNDVLTRVIRILGCCYCR
jgi:hypothetical protein